MFILLLREGFIVEKKIPFLEILEENFNALLDKHFTNILHILKKFFKAPLPRCENVHSFFLL